ncbi:MAG: hypothetical protein EOL95_08385 [Bacteroidia bacterium]|nr:hypothetical protein [Bacteroidia bacterium]
MNLELRFGQPNSYDFDTIIDQFSGTKINSFRTSSIPLVQFWKDTNNSLNDLFNKLDLQCDKPTLCFEYPTKPKQGTGKSSMTDLMILGNDFKVAIEAKFTEYVKIKPDLIDDWKLAGDKENRIKVLNYWTSLIKPFSNGYDNDSLNQISYQFYHRTASACNTNGQAIVVYQVFYDSDTLGFLENYKSKLMDYIKILNPNNKLSFYIWEIEVNQLIMDNKNIDPFVEMKSRNVYEFAKTRLEKIKNFA